MEGTPVRLGLGITNCRGASEVVAGVAEAEKLGAEIAFVAEDINCRDAFSLLALAAGATNQIRLSTGVVNPFTRNPTSLAMAVATLDEISGGRAGLGLGTSSPALIEGQMGIPSRNPGRVMRECTEIVRGLLEGRAVSFDGDVFHYDGASLEVRPVQMRVPIVFAAMGPRMLQLAGAVADGVLLNVGASTEYVRWAVRQIALGAKGAGRNPAEVTVAAWLSTYITDDYERGLQRAREWLAVMLSVPRQGELLLSRSGIGLGMLGPIRSLVSGYPHAGDPQAAAQHVPPAVAKRLTLIGTSRVVAERVNDYREAGVDLPVVGLSALRHLMAEGGLSPGVPGQIPAP